MVQTNEITITIDGVQIKTRPGKMVLEAAIDAGIYVPYLCYHQGMKPYAACRMCVVEVADDGRGNPGRGFPASCTLPVADKMVIKSGVTQVNELRRNIMDMLLAEHPHGCLTCHRIDLCGPEDVCLRHVSVNDRCVTCPKNERCELKDTVRYLGMNLESPLNYRYRKLPIEVGDPFYDRDYNLCIVCVRCVRVCEEVRGDNALTVIERSGKGLVGTAFGTSLLESGCEFCGACVDVCPVGALVESDHKWEKARRVERTVCPQCPIGCQLNLEVNSFGKMVRSIPEINAPANKGQACFKGKFGLDFVNQKSRLKRPMVRKNGKLEETTWDEALGVIAQRLGEYRGDAFAMLTSPNSTNEEQYLAQKFTRAVMGTNNIDQTSNTRPGLVESLADTLGYRAATNNVWEVENAQCIIAFNTNLTEEQNVIGVPVKRAVKKGTKLIVIDPREVELTRYAALWLRPKPGTELLLLGGILKEIISQGLEKKDWIEKNVQGIDALKQSLASLNIDNVAAETGVVKGQIQEAARIYGTAATGAILYALDNIPSLLHKDCVYALASMALMAGNVGRPSTGLCPMRQGANEQGAWDVGAVPHLLPGYASVSDASARTKFQKVWKLPAPQSQGLGVVEAFDAMRAKRVKALFLVGDSPNFNNGVLGDGISALKSLEFLVVMDSFLTEAAQQAHVVLPRATFAEKSGTFTNIERRVQTVRPVIAPKNLDAKPEWWVICELARLMQADGFSFESPAQVMDEIASLTPIYGGVSHQRLEKEGRLVLRPATSNPLPNQVLYSDKEYRGLQWPCPDPESKGTAILYSDGFPGGKARVMAPQFRKVSLGDGLVFVPGRVLLQSHREMEVVKGKQNRIVREELIEVNPQDAASLGIREGDAVKVQVNGHSIQGRAALRESLQRGMVASTSLFGQLMTELDASEEPDPMAKTPTLLIKPAKLAKV